MNNGSNAEFLIFSFILNLATYIDDQSIKFVGFQIFCCMNICQILISECHTLFGYFPCDTACKFLFPVILSAFVHSESIGLVSYKQILMQIASEIHLCYKENTMKAIWEINPI